MPAEQGRLFHSWPSVRQVRAEDGERRARGPLTDRELKVAQRLRSNVYMGCPHEPRCDDWRRCVELIARDQRRKGYAR